MRLDIYDNFISFFKEYTKTTSVVGKQWDESTFQGSQVTRAQYERVVCYVNLGKQEGATAETEDDA